MSRQLNPKKFQVVLVSPRPYFVFTPLLASTSVGTLEFRTTLEPSRSRSSDLTYFQGWADDVNFYNKTVTIEGTTQDVDSGVLVSGTKSKPQKGDTFPVSYDKLIVTVGCYSQTFGTKGVKENAYFLKDVADARKIRKRILQCFETASLPTTSPKLRESLLNFAIVGGGPTGIEFAAELHDLCHEDLSKIYPELIKYMRISVYDVAPTILSMFDKSLAKYALDKFNRDHIHVKTEHHIQELSRPLPDGRSEEIKPSDCYTLTTKEEGEVSVGMCVWSTGLMMNPFIQQTLSVCHRFPDKSATLQGDQDTSVIGKHDWNVKRHPKTGGLMVDDQFHVQLIAQSKDGAETEHLPQAVVQDVFALGDVASLEIGALPATAQVANQESKWLAQRLNRGDLSESHFKFHNLGIMTYLGSKNAIMQTNNQSEIKGLIAWIIWRGAYLTRTISLRNKLLIPIYWSINWIFGRDISRF